ncbi:MAG: hypothetical protein LBL62_08150 [Planctomycetaceae bacterium]|jgi:hypothetical protein|nr:hypothetical protein [Planctomycetaceae bacterium]
MIKVFYTITAFLFVTALYAQIPVAPSGNPAGNPYVPVPQQYYQPVKINAPEGTKITFAIDEKFVQRQTTPYAVGLLVGGDYRLRITDIPFQPGREIFPTVKIIARTYPPQGLELEFPIRIDITQEDLELALDGKFVTRVVYLENPQTAMPVRSDLSEQISTDVSGGVNPITVAATMGQPVAVIRIGGRIPNTLGVTDPAFFHGSPSWIAFDKTPSNRYEMTRYQSNPNRTTPFISGKPIIPLR